MRILLQCIFFLFILTTCLSERTHVITTPRIWPSGGESQICVFLSGTPVPGDSLSYSVKTNSGMPVILKTDLKLADQWTCQTVTVPDTYPRGVLTLSVSGIISGHEVSYSKRIDIERATDSVFLQTDKQLYKPSQTVKIRLLTISGPSLSVSNKSYGEIWIENPIGTKIKQWLDVENKQGLVHLEYTLSDEPEEGTYTINVRYDDGRIKGTEFKIEDFVLPRFEVTIKPPSYYLGTSKYFDFDVCATYTFGQPVRGVANIVIKGVEPQYGNGPFFFRPVVPPPPIGGYRTLKLEENIIGCKKFSVPTANISTLDFVDDQIEVEASVTEEGTDIVLEADSQKTDITLTALSFKDRSNSNTHKPEGLFIAKFDIKNPDGSGAPDEPIEICILGQGVARDDKWCLVKNTNADGVLKYILPPHLQNTLTMRSLNHPDRTNPDNGKRLLYESETTIWRDLYHSPSNSSIMIGLNDDKLNCGEESEITFELPIHYAVANQELALINVQVISRGQIQFTTSVEQPTNAQQTWNVDNSLYFDTLREPETLGIRRGSLNIPVSLPKSVSPKAKIVVWLIRDDGEVVSDSIEVDVAPCLSNNIGFTWSNAVSKPGGPETLKLTGAPNSFCSIGVVDKSVQLLGDHEEITDNSILKVASNYEISSSDNSQLDAEKYCEPKYRLERTTTPPSSWTRGDGWVYQTDGADALTLINDAGIYWMTDAESEFRRCNRRPDFHVVMFVAGGPLPGLPLAGPPIPAADSPHSFSPAAAPPSSSNAAAPPPRSTRESEPRSHFPETWLWDLVYLSDNGSFEENVTLPDTITEWVGKTICVHPTEGVGISKSSSITTFTDFFVDLSLPPAAKRGEVFPVKISVFNYLREPLPIEINFEESPDYDILDTHSVKPRFGRRHSCVQNQDKVVHSIPIRPTKTGDVNLTVSAFVDINAITSCGGGEGADVEKRDTVIKPIRVDYEGFPVEESFTDYLCKEEGKPATVKWSLETPSEIVEDSGRGFVSVVGDLMGPSAENLGHLVKKPTGCGEQNMLGFAPNIFVMQYLEASKQATEKIVEKATSHMETGYKRELNYRHKDGSYSAFGSSDDSGSTWLTAFVLKCYSQAIPYIAIDPEDIEVSMSWLKNLQDPDGCFSSVGRVLHKGMKGGIKNSKSSALLTAFVLISLLESGESSSSPVVKKALECIMADKPTDSYGLAVQSYAMALASNPLAKNLLDIDLLPKANETPELLRWDEEKETQNSEALNLETAGYAILALINANAQKYRPQISKIVKYINSQRNGDGGFISTQDTIVSLQALALYESAFPQGNLNANVKINIGGVQQPDINVNSRNKLVLQTTDIPSVPTDVAVDVQGSGCVLVQAILRYNIPKPKASEAFSLMVSPTTAIDNGCKTKRIEVCASYQLPDGESNMATIEVDVITGYIPDKKDLKKLVDPGRGIKRYEVDGSKVIIYVDEFTKDLLCISFKVLREFEVEDVKNGTVIVADYYSPEYSISESYALPPASECLRKPPPPPTGVSEPLQRVSGPPGVPEPLQREPGPPGVAVPLQRIPGPPGSEPLENLGGEVSF